MSPLLLLTGQDCHLAAAAPPLRPVLFDPAGRVVAYGRLSAKRLRRRLRRREGDTLAVG
jgi:hypothetical protein